jgi:GTPase SAR1 family protein
MGNNHDKYFSKEKRKLLILGLNGVGKSSNINLNSSLGKDTQLK